MRPTMYVPWLTAALCCVPASVAGQSAADTVSLNEALALLGRHSPGLDLARARLRSTLGAALQGRAAPNPVASVTHEDLGAYAESYVNLTQRVDFLWERGGRSDQARAEEAEARARFLADSARLVLDLERTYVDGWWRREAMATLAQVGGVLGRLTASAEARFAEGDLAGYDLRRLRYERARIARRLAIAELEAQDAELRLGALLLLEAEMAPVRPRGLPSAGPPELPAGDLVARALGRRPEAAAARAAAATRAAEAGLAGTSVLSGTALTGGAKRQSDGQAGFFVGLQLPLPFADRRAGATDAARAASQAADAENVLVGRWVAREASLAAARLESARRQRALLGAGGEAAAELLRIAEVAYGEGELGIMELVDAAAAFLEARLLESQIEAELWVAYFELEHAMGGLPEGAQTGVER